MDQTSMTRRQTLGIIGVAAAMPALPAAARDHFERPRYHIASPAGGWINDPQRPIWMNGAWHLWALYNPTPMKGGTAWRRWTSTDMVTWQDKGISIPRGTTPYGDVWTGTTVVDAKNVAGFGAGTLIAIVTMPARDASGENQSCALWYSRDGGATFAFHDIVLRGPGRKAFRDPSVFWHAPSNRWMLTLSEEGRVGFYASDDLRRWRSVGSFASDLVGSVMECTHLFQLHLHEADGRVAGDKWILLVGGNGTKQGFTVGTYYWVGDFDGTTFTPLRAEGRWLDGGADYYATTIWTDPRAAYPLDSAYAIAWMSNWDYVRQLAPSQGYQGQLSIVRQLRLQRVRDEPVLLSSALKGQSSSFVIPRHEPSRIVEADRDYAWPSSPSCIACRADITVSKINGIWPQALNIRVKRGTTDAASIGILFQEGVVTLGRVPHGFGAPDSKPWRTDRRIVSDFTEDTVKMSIFVDVASIEIFMDSGESAMSQLIAAPILPTVFRANTEGDIVKVTLAYAAGTV